MSDKNWGGGGGFLFKIARKTETKWVQIFLYIVLNEYFGNRKYCTIYRNKDIYM